MLNRDTCKQIGELGFNMGHKNMPHSQKQKLGKRKVQIIKQEILSMIKK